jgi:hypothetical protein
VKSRILHCYIVLFSLFYFILFYFILLSDFILFSLFYFSFALKTRIVELLNAPGKRSQKKEGFPLKFILNGKTFQLEASHVNYYWQRSWLLRRRIYKCMDECSSFLSISNSTSSKQQTKLKIKEKEFLEMREWIGSSPSVSSMKEVGEQLLLSKPNPKLSRAMTISYVPTEKPSFVSASFLITDKETNTASRFTFLREIEQENNGNVHFNQKQLQAIISDLEDLFEPLFR